MSKCDLLIPDRLMSVAQAVFPNSRFKQYDSPHRSPHHLFASMNGVEEIAWAKSILHDPQEYFATPCYLNASAASAYLDPKAPSLDDELASMIIQALNEFYQDCGIYFKAINASLWSVQYQYDLNHVPIETMLLENLAATLKNDLSFAKFATELQMFLSNLTVCQKIGMNFIWIWGRYGSPFKHNDANFYGHTILHRLCGGSDEPKLIFSKGEYYLYDCQDYFSSPMSDDQFKMIMKYCVDAFESGVLKKLRVSSLTQQFEMKKKRFWFF